MIDGHAHVWRPRLAFDIKPIRDNPLFQSRDWLPEDIASDMASLGIERLVVTQSAPESAETDFMLAHCRDVPQVCGVVGWVDLASDDITPELDRRCEEPKFVGIRAQLRRMPEDDFILRPEVRTGLRAVAERQLTIVLLSEQRHHEACLRVLREQPDLRAVLNHGGMPDIAGGDLSLWARTMACYAKETSVVTQLSGLVYLAGPNWTLDSIRPVAFKLFELFGPERIMFTSDWPLALLYGVDYASWWRIVQDLLDELGVTRQERSGVLGGVAASAYRVPGCPALLSSSHAPSRQS
jgi:L-fuconolactonase